MKLLKILLLSISTLFSLCSCNDVKQDYVKVILEDGDYRCANNNISLPRGSDFVFELTLDINKVVNGASYKNYSIVEELNNETRFDKITFHQVNYSVVISLDIVEAVKVTYIGKNKTKDEYITKNHQRINTSNDLNCFNEDGFALVGWKKNDEIISLGSRITIDANMTLEGIYYMESDKSLFEYEVIDNSRIKINDYKGHDEIVVIPQYIDAKYVISIGKNAFNDLNIDELILPRSLAIVEDFAFNNCRINSLIFYDNLSTVSDDSFNNCLINHIRINAINKPAYITSYYGTYADKVDRLILLKDKKKIILYSGSSTRFGFDSEVIDKTFLDYDVINMGVFAYTQSYPQVEVISNFTTSEDIIINSPEFDAIDYQINLRPIFDADFIKMIEANYDIIKLLDYTKYQSFFSSFNRFQYERNNLSRFTYLDSPNQYDEDGNYLSSPSYNRYGDYVIYRPNNDKRISFGIKRAYYNKQYFPEEYLNNFVNCYQMLKISSLYYDYSPRMNISISEDSSEQTINELGIYLKEHINMTFLSNIDDSLMDPLYFYGTDNHLSTEGVRIRTNRLMTSLLNCVKR